VSIVTPASEFLSIHSLLFLCVAWFLSLCSDHVAGAVGEEEEEGEEGRRRG